jgi:NCS1 family nucleobase:cation symporter-1
VKSVKKQNNLLTKDLLPIAHSDRNLGMLGYSFMWVGIAVIIATFALGGEGVQSMELGWVLLACLLANIALGFFITVTGDIGIEHGLAFPVYLRAPFGIVGTHIPSLIRGVLGAIWFGIQTYFGALAINYIFKYLTGFDNWFVWYLVFAAVQVLNTAYGIKAVEKFSNIAAPSIIVISIWLYIRLEGVASDAGRNVWHTVVGSGTGSGFLLSTFVTVFFVNMSYWSTSASDSLNLTRHVKAPQYEKNWLKRNKNALLAHMVALPLTQSLMIVIGGVSMIAVGNWNPVEAVQSTATGFILIILLLLVVFAQWSTNSSGNLYPSAVTIINAGAPRISYASGVVIAGIIGTVMQPWEIMNSILGFLGFMGSVYSAIAGIMFADYYLLRKRRINVPDLFKKKGQYFYKHGWNFAGIISLIIGLLVANQLSAYAFLVGFVVSTITYYILGKFWWFKIYKQAEIEENHPDKYLGITVGRDWVIEDLTADAEPMTDNHTTATTVS